MRDPRIMGRAPVALWGTLDWQFQYGSFPDRLRAQHLERNSLTVRAATRTLKDMLAAFAAFDRAGVPASEAMRRMVVAQRQGAHTIDDLRRRTRGPRATQ